MKWVKRILLALVVLVVAAQFVRPARTNPPIVPAHELHAPPQIEQILARSCNDCHSSRTVWPWYSNIAPASWFLADHVNEGRHELNFSELESYKPRKAAHKMQEVCEQVDKGEMPFANYVWLHPEAKLSEADRAALCTWAKNEQRLRGGPSKSSRSSATAAPRS